jgi:ABC-type transporter Mla MlaB component
VADPLRITNVSGVAGLIIAGEIDESAYLTLAERLARLASHGDVHIDLGGVEFCDLAGLRAIVCATGSPSEVTGLAGQKQPGRHVVLHAVPPRLLRILKILGWDEIPAVVFDEKPLAADGAHGIT